MPLLDKNGEPVKRTKCGLCSKCEPVDENGEFRCPCRKQKEPDSVDRADKYYSERLGF